jgi:hypothetical protein
MGNGLERFPFQSAEVEAEPGMHFEWIRLGLPADAREERRLNIIVTQRFFNRRRVLNPGGYWIL